jgi:hypothetical protein
MGLNLFLEWLIDDGNVLETLYFISNSRLKGWHEALQRWGEKGKNNRFKKSYEFFCYELNFYCWFEIPRTTYFQLLLGGYEQTNENWLKFKSIFTKKNYPWWYPRWNLPCWFSLEWKLTFLMNLKRIDTQTW